MGDDELHLRYGLPGTPKKTFAFKNCGFGALPSATEVSPSW